MIMGPNCASVSAGFCLLQSKVTLTSAGNVFRGNTVTVNVEHSR